MINRSMAQSDFPSGRRRIAAVFSIFTMNIMASAYEFALVESNEESAEPFLRDDRRRDNPNFLAYSLDLILDPCRNHGPNCCWDRYGAPEYIRTPGRSSLGHVWALGPAPPNSNKDFCDPWAGEQSNAAQSKPRSLHHISRYPYYCAKPCLGVFVPMALQSETFTWCFDRIDADENFVWAVNMRQSEGAIFKRPVDGRVVGSSEDAWTYIGVDARDLTASTSGAVFKITRNNELLQCDKPCSGEFKLPTEDIGYPNDFIVGAARDALHTLLSDLASTDEDSIVQVPYYPPRYDVDFINLDVMPSAIAEATEMVQVDGDATHLYVLFDDGMLFMRRLHLDPIEGTTWYDTYGRDHTWMLLTGPNAFNGPSSNKTKFREGRQEPEGNPDRNDQMIVHYVTVSAANDYLWAAGTRTVFNESMSGILRMTSAVTEEIVHEVWRCRKPCRIKDRSWEDVYESNDDPTLPWERWEPVLYPGRAVGETSWNGQGYALEYGLNSSRARELRGVATKSDVVGAKLEDLYIVQLDADQTSIWAVTANGKMWKRKHDTKKNFGWFEVGFTDENSDDATLSNKEKLALLYSEENNLFESSAYLARSEERRETATRIETWSRITASANPEMPPHVKVGGTDTPMDDFETYTVQREAGVCDYKLQHLSPEDSKVPLEECADSEDLGCKWNIATKRCEKKVGESESRLEGSSTSFDEPACVAVQDHDSDGNVQRRIGFERARASESSGWTIFANPNCISEGVRALQSEILPACWDYNDTVSARRPCHNHIFDTTSGDVRDTIESDCVTVGFSSTAFIVQCGNTNDDGSEDESCGSFIEVHLPNNNNVIASARISSAFTAGYRTMAVPLRWTDVDTDPATGRLRKRHLCLGEYELWWVQRLPIGQDANVVSDADDDDVDSDTASSHFSTGRRIVEYRKPFKVLEPPCDWNKASDRYEVFATELL